MDNAGWKRKIIIGAFGTGLLLGGSFYYIQANTNTFYQVTIDGDPIGYVSTPAVVGRWVEEKKREVYRQEGLIIDTDVNIQFDQMKFLNGKSDDNRVVRQMEDRTHFYIVGASVSVNNKIIGYVKNYKIAEEVLSQYKDNILASSKMGHGNKEKQTARIATIDESEKEQQTEKAFFKEMILLEQRRVDASQILNKEQLLQRLSQENNGSILTVITEEKMTVVEEIPFSIRYQEDDTLPQGTIRIIKQGSYGSKWVSYNIKKENGIIKSKSILAEKIIVEPRTQLIVKGTKIIPTTGTGTFIWPVRGGIITSGYEMRRDGFHAGIDIAGTEDKNIKASDHGVVESIGWDGGFGKSIVINHNNQYKTRYSHLSKYLVKKGEIVEQGQVIAIMGSTGNSTGIHLDFRIMKEGKELNPLNFVEQPN